MTRPIHVSHTAEDGSVLGYYVCRDADYEKEIEYLKKKVEAGADFVVRCVALPGTSRPCPALHCPALPDQLNMPRT